MENNQCRSRRDVYSLSAAAVAKSVFLPAREKHARRKSVGIT